MSEKKQNEKVLNNHLASYLNGLPFFKLVSNFFILIILWVLSVTAHLTVHEAVPQW